ncbi:uncharacterized protein LOC106011658 [Aplysia californica]|uniref:Uncharacterized protein LOC106011658 n=1 Tax=Aplysia californica TaxID=6500 RepID=A0ABM0ZZ53_APLCA|nr:uncharacterized protein LOC106011658 [Aplysia californica]
MQEMLMHMGRYSHLLQEPLTGLNASSATGRGESRTLHFRVGESASKYPGLHGHDVTLSAEEYRSLVGGSDVTVTTSIDLGHSHELLLHFNPADQTIHIKMCDCKARCWDGHPDKLIRE